MANDSQAMGQELGELLRGWRRLRGMSQLHVALETEISQRHISFVESGRSVPSRALLLRLATMLDVPLRERNALLLAAGYAPMYRESALEAPEMRTVLAVVERMLRQQEPYPALVMDRHWNVLRTNEAAPRLFGTMVDLARWPRPRNLLDLMFAADGLRPFIENWDEVAAGLRLRVEREAVGHAAGGETRELLRRLREYPAAGDTVRGVSPRPLPVVPVTFLRDGERLRYFSMVATVGLPEDIGAQELRVECMFPVE